MKTRIKTVLALHILLMMLSLSSVCSKMTGSHPFLSAGFLLWYALALLCLAVFALGWQQVIRHMPLTEAYASRSVTVIWGFVWSILLFREHITAGKITGVVLITAGVVLYVLAGSQEDGHG